MAVVSTDGTTVWVNDDVQCIGRFGLYAFDVWPTGTATKPGDVSPFPPPPLDKLDAEAWREFKRQMLKQHNTEVPDTYAPTRFKKQL